jgi:hypothetical protein
VAEDTGLIVELGTQVLRIACHQLRAWREYAPDLQLAVNLSARKAARADLCDIVQTALIDAGLPAEALALELSESVLPESARSTLGKLGELRRSGVQIGIDDFGTGYASLRYLRELPVTFLKVDRSFVAGMTTNHHDAVIVQTVTRLARDLGLGCIARRHRNRSTAATHPGDRSLCTRLPVRAPRAPPPTSCTTCAAQAPKRRGHNDSKRPPRACSSAPGSTLLLEPSSTCAVPPRIQVTIHCRAPFTADSRAAVRTAGPKHVRRLPGWTAVVTDPRGVGPRCTAPRMDLTPSLPYTAGGDGLVIDAREMATVCLARRASRTPAGRLRCGRPPQRRSVAASIHPGALT